MHSIMIALAAIAALVLRWAWSPGRGNWQQRWQKALLFFLLPILLLAMTLIAIACMGPQGTMAGMPTVSYTYQLVCLALGVAIALSLHQIISTQKTLNHLHQYPPIMPPPGINQTLRLLPQPQVFCAQMGWWQPQMVVTQGLLDLLDTEHLNAVFAHEQAHYHYRDTFWFFTLGLLRRLTSWLPHSQDLWEELLTLRELRADAFASQKVDKLVLAEALLLAVSTPIMATPEAGATLHPSLNGDRLQERIDALLETHPTSPPPPCYWSWGWLLMTLLPLVALPFHS